MKYCFAPCPVAETLPFPIYPPGGATSPPLDPTILAITCPTIPSTVVAGAPDGLVRVLGQNFTNTCQVFMDNAGQVTNFVSATELTFTAPHSLETTAHTETITVKDGAANAQGTCQFTYTAAPLLQIICPCVPASAVIGAAPLQVTVNGQNFKATTQVTLDGTPQTTVYVSPTQLKFTIDPTAETVRTAIVGVTDGGVASTTTCPFDFIQTVLVPTLTSIWPDMIGYGDAGKVVTLTGTNFDATSLVMRGVTPLPTTFVNATTLTITTAPVSATVAYFDVRVRNGVAGAYEWSNDIGASCVLHPGISQLTPNSAPAGSAPLVVNVAGPNLGNTVEVLVDGVGVPTRWLSGVQCEFDVDPTTMTAGTVLDVTVRLGHYHTPQGHDDVRVVDPPLSLSFTIT